MRRTYVGLDPGEEIGHDLAERVFVHNCGLRNLVRIVLEQSTWDADCVVFRLLQEGRDENAGTVLQAALYRTKRRLEKNCCRCRRTSDRFRAPPGAADGRPPEEGRC
ncbi:MAG: hypothetical protein AVDCRST_MAG19-4624 [uncultured Thermomicrobiales bacterium]|uniref:Uncharacterized protein n=1 Tax=uncultured Thermomicrobiales bacterium TaxID=1645740 RepID=A0A6J4VQ13_9BACT|nr:MAG: hypothetical protein AVDCRST_MAG19-4624 [uncultured Thermomicrobiales bacterium]